MLSLTTGAKPQGASGAQLPSSRWSTAASKRDSDNDAFVRNDRAFTRQTLRPNSRYESDPGPDYQSNSGTARRARWHNPRRGSDSLLSRARLPLEWRDWQRRYVRHLSESADRPANS